MKLQTTNTTDLSYDLNVKIDDVGNLYIHKKGRQETRDAKAILILNHLEAIKLREFFFKVICEQ